MNQQPSALLHADRMEREGDIQAARELRRLYEVNEELLGVLKVVVKWMPLVDVPGSLSHLDREGRYLEQMTLTAIAKNQQG